MSVVYSTTVKNTRMSAVVTALGSAGKLVIGTSALSGATGVLVTIPLDNPAGSVSGAAIDFTETGMSADATATGTAALAELRDSSDTVIASGLTVGTSGTNIILSSTSISSGTTVTISSATLTHG